LEGFWRLEMNIGDPLFDEGNYVETVVVARSVLDYLLEVCSQCGESLFSINLVEVFRFEFPIMFY
jgi:hypothetical protein